MPNEFVTRNGFISLNSSQITGSLSVTQGVTASLFGTSSWSSNAVTSSNSLTASFVLQAVSASFATTASFISQAVSASFATTASNALTASFSFNAVSASFAATASSADDFLVRQNVTASNGLITGTLTAQTLVVQTITSSILYSSGSNIFGNQPSNVQQMTGSLRVSGSGNHFIVGGNVGVNMNAPIYTLDVSGSGDFSNNLTVSGSLLATGSVQITGSFNSIPVQSVVLAASGGFSKSFSIINNSNIAATDVGRFPVWRCNVPCTASMVLGYTDSGSAVLVNAFKNSSALLSSNLSISTDTWVSSSTLQNQNFTTGDILAFQLVSFSSTPKEITIQTSFNY